MYLCLSGQEMIDISPWTGATYANFGIRHINFDITRLILKPVPRETLGVFQCEALDFDTKHCLYRYDFKTGKSIATESEERAMDEWISVSDKLPEKTGVYRGIVGGKFLDVVYEGNGFFCTARDYIRHIIDGDELGYLLDITHWMPIVESEE